MAKAKKNDVYVKTIKHKRYFVGYRDGKVIARRKVSQRKKENRINLARAREIFKGGSIIDGRIMKGGTFYPNRDRSSRLLEGGKTYENSTSILTDIKNPTAAPKPYSPKASKMAYVCDGYHKTGYVTARSHFLGSSLTPTKALCVKDARSKFWRIVYGRDNTLDGVVDYDDEEAIQKYYKNDIKGYSEGWVYYVTKKSSRKN